LNGLAYRPGPIELARADANIRSLPGQQPNHALSYGSRAAQHERRRLAQVEVSRGSPHSRRGRGIGTVGIEKNRHTQSELRQ
jgi:hypothetical protein